MHDDHVMYVLAIQIIFYFGQLDAALCTGVANLVQLRVWDTEEPRQISCSDASLN